MHSRFGVRRDLRRALRRNSLCWHGPDRRRARLHHHANCPWRINALISVRKSATPHEEVRFARDSPLEEAGFEPWVPVTKRGSLSISETVTEAIKAGFAPVVGWGEPLRRRPRNSVRNELAAGGNRIRTAGTAPRSHDQGLESD